MLAVMPAVIFHGEGQWSMDQVTVPAISCDDEVLLAVDRAGIFGMDQHSSVSVNQCDIFKRKLTLHGSFIQKDSIFQSCQTF